MDPENHWMLPYRDPFSQSMLVFFRVFRFRFPNLTRPWWPPSLPRLIARGLDCACIEKRVLGFSAQSGITVNFQTSRKTIQEHMRANKI